MSELSMPFTFELPMQCTIKLALLLVLTISRQLSAAEPSSPNIILIMCDDMGFSDIGCYGGEVVTPNLDRMAAEGMRFTQFYNNAKCNTTRASVVTGLYPRFRKGELKRDMVTVGEVMGGAGYLTALCGKWHLGTGDDQHPFKRGFQRYYGLLDGCCNFFNPLQRDPPYKGARVRKFGMNDQAVTEFPEDYYTTDAFTDHAIKAIHAADEQSKPFFVHVTYTAPHYPLHAKPEDIAKYRGRYKMGWDKMRRQRWQRQQAMGLVTSSWKLSDDDVRAYDWETANHDFEDHRMAVYAAMIDSMDQNIGRLLDTLRETGHDKDTLVMFLSDNGGCAEEPGGRDPAKRNPGPGDDYVAVGPSWGWAQNAPFRRYKSWLYEGGITTPFIAWWPDEIPANKINREPAHIIDLLPTFLDLVEADYPEEYNGHQILPVEGLSMRELLKGKTREGHQQLAWYWAGNRAIRQGDWKLVWDKLNPDKQWELYDLSVDRCELNNLAEDQTDRVAKMSADWFVWADKVQLKVKK